MIEYIIHFFLKNKTQAEMVTGYEKTGKDFENFHQKLEKNLKGVYMFE